MMGRPQDRDHDDGGDRDEGQQETRGVRRALLEVLVLLLHHERGGLGLADVLTDDARRRAEVVRSWAEVLDASLNARLSAAGAGVQ